MYKKGIMKKKFIKQTVSFRLNPGLKNQMDKLILDIKDDYPSRSSFIERAIIEKMAEIVSYKKLQKRKELKKYDKST